MSIRAFVSFFALFLVLLPASFLLAQTAESPSASSQKEASPPDLSGVWSLRESPGTRYLGYEFAKNYPPMTPWGEEKFKANKPSFGPNLVNDPNDPTYDCFLPGLPRVYLHPAPFEIFQVPGRVIMLFEYDNIPRQIWLDTGQHRMITDVAGLWMGESLGHWEGDALVVNTTNFNDKTWLDRAGHPHSDQLHVIERIRRVDHDHLQIDLTIDDPKAYTQPIVSQLDYELKPNWTIQEHACTDYPNPNR